MARRTHVPKFGNWDANDHMPFTVVFDHARQGRGKPVNPNDPTENPGAHPAGRGNGAPMGRRYNPNDPEDPLGAGPDPPHERTTPPSSREGSSGGSGRPQHQPHGAAAQRRPVAAVNAQVNGMPSRAPPADPRRGTSRDATVDSPSASFSADQSPSHPTGATGFQGSQGRGARAASPAWEARRKSPSEDGPLFAPATPNRSRLRALRDDGSSKGPSAALPKFGAWDAQDPGSGDGFTVIFNNARNEKKTGGPVNIPRTPDHKHPDDLYENASRSNYQKSHSASKKSCWNWCLGEPNVHS